MIWHIRCRLEDRGEIKSGFQTADPSKTTLIAHTTQIHPPPKLPQSTCIVAAKEALPHFRSQHPAISPPCQSYHERRCRGQAETSEAKVAKPWQRKLVVRGDPAEGWVVLKVHYPPGAAQAAPRTPPVRRTRPFSRGSLTGIRRLTTFGQTAVASFASHQVSRPSANKPVSAGRGRWHNSCRSKPQSRVGLDRRLTQRWGQLPGPAASFPLFATHQARTLFDCRSQPQQAT